MKKLILLIITIIALASIASATMTYYWVAPNYDGQVIDVYPQKLRAYISSDGTINHCNITIGSDTTYAPINAQNTELNINKRLKEGTYTAAINCTDSDSNAQETKTFEVDNFSTLNKQQEKSFQFNLWLIIFIAMIILFFAAKQHWTRIFTGIGLALTSIYLIVIEGTENAIIWLPIGFSIILLILELTGKIDK